MIFVNSFTSFPIVVNTTSYEYPPIAMTSFNTPTVTGQPYGNGNYEATASSAYPGTPPYAGYAVFNKLTTSLFWNSGDTTSGYSSSTGSYIAGVYNTDVSSIIYGGEWIKLVLSAPITLTSYKLRSGPNGTQFCKSWILAGSNNGGTTWSAIDIKTAQPNPGNNTEISISTFSVVGSVAYSSYIIIVRETFGTSQYTSLSQWRLIGY